MKSEFLLNPEVVYLNHGAFGATPRAVFERYQAWQRELEAQPTAFITGELPAALTRARASLAAYLCADAGDLTFVPNPTFAVNQVVRSLDLGPGDEVLTTDHEYGACEKTWRYYAGRRGFEVVRQPVRLPLASPATVADAIWQGVTDRTKVLFISHITSATAMRMPVEILCARAAAAGILCFVDGAHAPSQIDLDLQALGADFYTGACHKWLCAPKGASFLFVRRERQPLIEPLVVSWGYGENPKPDFGSPFLNHSGWLGTRDLSAYLAVPDAIAFQAERDWPAVRSQCQTLLREAVAGIAAITGLPAVYGDDAAGFMQLAVAPLPQGIDPQSLKRRLLEHHRIEVPINLWQDRVFVRVSVQCYNNRDDVDRLLDALSAELRR